MVVPSHPVPVLWQEHPWVHGSKPGATISQVCWLKKSWQHAKEEQGKKIKWCPQMFLSFFLLQIWFVIFHFSFSFILNLESKSEFVSTSFHFIQFKSWLAKFCFSYSFISKLKSESEMVSTSVPFHSVSKLTCQVPFSLPAGNPTLKRHKLLSCQSQHNHHL